MLALAFTVAVAKSWLFFLAIACFIVAIELVWGRHEPVVSAGRRVRAMLFHLLYLPIAVSIGVLMRPLTGPPLLDLGMWAVLLVPFLWDFFYYWTHRAQHAIPFLWRFHAVHHSIERLAAGSGFHHPMEAAVRAVLVTVPLSFVTTQPWIAGAVLGLQGIYLHSEVRPHFGRLAWIVCDNRVHRIHHSLEAQHFDKNFGAFTLIWDKLFGTAHFPQNHEWPDVGLDDRSEPRTVSDWLLQPVRGLWPTEHKHRLTRL